VRFSKRAIHSWDVEDALGRGRSEASPARPAEIAPEDKNRNEMLGARVNLYMAAEKWDMAAAVANICLQQRVRWPVGSL
jgi:hypothetical protein